MIFVTVGNSLRPFLRLLNAVDQAAERGLLQKDILYQSGHSTFEATVGRTIPFLSRDDFSKAVREASVIVSHAGAGTILACASAGKKPVLVPRQKRYDEIVDDHQIEMCELLEETGRAFYVRDINQLTDAVNDASAQRLQPNDTIPQLGREIRQYLVDLAVERGRRAP